LVPVTIMTLPCTRLRQTVRMPPLSHSMCRGGDAYGALESAAMDGIFGISSNMPGSSRGLTSCSESSSTRALGDEDILRRVIKAILLY
jgi:hypothetical protein